MKGRAGVALIAALVGITLPAAFLLSRNASVPRARAFEFLYIARVPELPEGSGTLRLWIPVPESDGHQEISGLQIESPAPYRLQREPEYGNLYAYMEGSARTFPQEVRLSFQVVRREHRVDPAAPPEAIGTSQATPPDLARFLEPDHLVPIDGLIGALARQETRGRERPLDKARAVYDYVVSTMRYDKSGDGWGRGDAIFACNMRRGNCTDFHALLIGMMRAAGIPARFEIGFPLPANRDSGEVPGYHCWAEFHLDGVGWVPVDASEAWKDPARRDYFFGAHDEHRVLFSRGRDIRFDPPQEGGPLNYFIYPYAELGGKPFTGVQGEYSFRDLGHRARGSATSQAGGGE